MDRECAISQGTNNLLSRCLKLIHLRILVVWYRAELRRGEALTLTVGIRRMVLIITGLSHILACIWWFIGVRRLSHHQEGQREHEGTVERDDDANNHWIGSYRGLGTNESWDDINVVEQYILSFYWITATLSTNGLVGQTLPKNAGELCFVCFLMLMSLTLYAYILGSISNLVTKKVRIKIICC